MKDVKILTGITTESDAGISLIDFVKEVLKECKVETDCECPGCGGYPTVNDSMRQAITLLAQRVLDLEARVTALE